MNGRVARFMEPELALINGDFVFKEEMQGLLGSPHELFIIFHFIDLCANRANDALSK